MAFNPRTWFGKPNVTTPIDAVSLNRIELGVKDAHDALGTKANAQAVADALAAAKATADNTYAPPVSVVQDFTGRIRTAQKDLNLLIVSDSTAAMAGSWANQLGAALKALFPTHTFVTHAFADGTPGSYSITETLTGTGARTVHIWIAAVAGKTWQYHWDASRREVMLGATTPDLVLFSLGYNENNTNAQAGNMDGLRGKAVVHIEQMRGLFPSAAIVLCSQGPLLAYPAANENFADLYRRIASQRGYGFIDINAAFRRDGRPFTDLVGSDQIHPTAAGFTVWLTEVLRHFTSTAQSQPLAAQRPAFHVSGRNLAPNPAFIAWGASVTDWTFSNCTPSKDVVNYETGSYALKLTKTAGGSAAYAEATLPLAEVKGQTVTLAIRLRVPAGGASSVGQVSVVSNASAAASDVWGAIDQYIWRTATYRVPSNATFARIRLYVDPSTGATLTEMSVDRVSVVLGDFPAELDAPDVPTALAAAAGAAAQGAVTPKLVAQPARRLLDRARMDIGTKPLVIPWLTASTGEGSVADADKSVHILLQKMLQSSYNPPGISGGYSLKVRAWPKTGSTGEVLDVDTKKLAVLNAGATASHTSLTPSTGIDIMYPSGPSYAQFTVAIDGGAPVTVTPGAGESYVGVWRSPVLTRAIHTYVITGVADGATVGLTYIRDQDEKAGVRLYNMGRAGAATTQFVDASADSTWARITSLVPDGAILMLGHNNMPNSIAQMKTDLGVICDRLQAAAGRPIWIGLTIQHSSDARWPEYAQALAEFAATRPATVSVHSFREFFATDVAGAAASGDFYTDNLHLNNFGHAIAADALADSMGLPSRRTWPVVPATEGQPSVEPGTPDISSNLMQRFHFDSLGLADGASVPSVAPVAGTRNLPLTQPTAAKQPTYLTNFANGHGGLRFTRANLQQMQTALFGAANNNDMPATLVAVVKRNVLTAAGFVIHGGVFNSVSTGLSIDMEITANLVRANTVTGGNLPSVGAPDLGIHVVIAVFSPDAGQSRLHVDGTVYTGTMTPGAQNVLPRLTVGSNLAGTNNYGEFDLGWIEEFDRALSTTEAEYLRQQLRTRFALA